MFLLELLAKSTVIYYVEGALSNGAEGAGSISWQRNKFYLLLEVKTGTIITQNAKGIATTIL